MKKGLLCFSLSAAGLAVLLAGCGTTGTVTEYDSAGRVVRTAVTKESFVKEIAESTKNKTIVAWESGWLAYVSATTTSTENVTPTVKIGVGKADKGFISFHKDHVLSEAQLTGLASVISATHQNLSVTASGVNTSDSAAPAAVSSTGK